MAEFPIGTIILIKNISIPAGWQVCDGSNGTPNLVGRLARGASSDGQLCSIGGQSSHNHTFSYNTGDAGTHGHAAISDGQSKGNDTSGQASTSVDASTTHTHSGAATFVDVANHNHTINTSGSGNNMPRYKKRVFIQKMS